MIVSLLEHKAVNDNTRWWECPFTSLEKLECAREELLDWALSKDDFSIPEYREYLDLLNDYDRAIEELVMEIG